jgi:predicted O-methyltransferase YrrM
LIKKYLQYLFSAKDEHSLHSPFVYELYLEIIKPTKKSKHIDYQSIESLRKQLKSNQTEITITDFGAGSKIYKVNQRTIAQIAKNAEKSPKFGKLLYCLIAHFQSKTIIDLGTSLGVTTIYQSKANRQAKIYSFEGCPATATIAQDNFQQLSCENIELIVGNIDETLPGILAKIEHLDFAFFDANHRYEPTVRYFEQCLEKAHEDSVFVFDDIHWSDEMEQAWEYIKSHDKSLITIDLFFVGLVFFRKKQPKQSFILKF